MADAALVPSSARTRDAAEITTRNRETVMAAETTFERHFSVEELSELWSMSDDFVRRLFIHEPGVLVFCHPRRGRRVYRTLRIPHAWFDQMYAPMAQRGIVFTAVGVITADPASVESVLTWADRLPRRVAYLVVENETDANATFAYWRNSAQARAFQQAFAPAVIQMAYRLLHLETAMCNYGVTLSAVVQRQTTVPELQLSRAVLRAEGYRQRLFEQFDTVTDLLLP